MTLYSDIFSRKQQEVDLVRTASEMVNDDVDDEDDEDDDDEDDEDAEDDDYYDDDSNGDEEFDGLSLNEEAEIMQYAIANATHHQHRFAVRDGQVGENNVDFVQISIFAPHNSQKRVQNRQLLKGFHIHKEAISWWVQ